MQCLNLLLGDNSYHSASEFRFTTRLDPQECIFVLHFYRNVVQLNHTNFKSSQCSYGEGFHIVHGHLLGDLRELMEKLLRACLEFGISVVLYIEIE